MSTKHDQRLSPPGAAPQASSLGGRGQEASPISEPVIELEGVSVCLGGRTILQEVTFTINPGEFIAVLGPNGAGKSTLLKVLLGLIRPSAGTVRLFGQAPRRGNRLIGYAPQHRTLEGALSLRARDLVGFGLDGHRWGPGWFPAGGRRRQAIIEAALAEVDALALADMPVAHLSGGEQQRLLIAQALLSQPRLLLLDEPLSNLDLSHEQEIIALIARLCRTHGMTVLLVSHDVNPLLPVIDRVLYLARGHAAIGKPEQVITSATLSALYGAPVEVVEALGRLFVVGVDI
ncbi:ABC transporter ATP-binding protein [Thermogemmatispora aurantia]|uniref:ABC transporter ATP-binding protein n=1 Tax=Thermogemmatispora aurantia TaxID=2045279 RepID=A0A5J4KEB4_9CHLR|nr:ABC transporter ATP-binding protein [Thermogemmatispora aurantia]GER85655.1 ABC transporter ATP-binding protein [Thermogemmatispora aurantia]